MLHSDSETYETDEYMYLRNQIVPRFPGIHDDQEKHSRDSVCSVAAGVHRGAPRGWPRGASARSPAALPPCCAVLGCRE